MDEAKRQILWDAYFMADVRQRYFLTLKDRLAARIRWLSVAIALLSFGPTVNFFWQWGYSDLLAGLGLFAAAIGIYLGTSGLLRSVAVAIQAATTWGYTANRYATLWARCQSGEDVWDEFQAVDRELAPIDAITTEHLTNDSKLIDQAWKASTSVLAPG